MPDVRQSLYREPGCPVVTLLRLPPGYAAAKQRLHKHAIHFFVVSGSLHVTFHVAKDATRNHAFGPGTSVDVAANCWYSLRVGTQGATVLEVVTKSRPVPAGVAEAVDTILAKQWAFQESLAAEHRCLGLDATQPSLNAAAFAGQLRTAGVNGAEAGGQSEDDLADEPVFAGRVAV